MEKEPVDYTKQEQAAACGGDCGFDYERFAREEAEREEQIPEVGGDPKNKKKKQEENSDTYDWMQSVVTAFLFCVIVFAFFVRIIGVIGQSMEPTFHEGDSVIISRLFYEPKQGDIVVLRKLSFQEEPIIKRIIATEGQTVDIDFETGIVYVDDKPLAEPYTAEVTRMPLDFDGKITVPENSVFVMGDNRNHSTDSRSRSLGFVDERYIMGKVLFRLLPLSQFGLVE